MATSGAGAGASPGTRDTGAPSASGASPLVCSSRRGPAAALPDAAVRLVCPHLGKEARGLSGPFLRAPIVLQPIMLAALADLPVGKDCPSVPKGVPASTAADIEKAGLGRAALPGLSRNHDFQPRKALSSRRYGVERMMPD